MADIIFNEGAVLAQLKETLNTQLVRASEPIVEKAVEEFRRVVRQKMAEQIIATIDSNLSVMKREQNIVITLRS